MKKLIILFSTIFIVSCAQDPVEIKATNNAELKISKLCDLDSTYTPGVYRFSDNSSYVYFIIVPNGVSYTCHQEYENKTEKLKTVQTITKKCQKN